MNEDIQDRSFDEEIAEYNQDPLSVDEEATESVPSQSTAKRGRPRIPEKWTQVISLEHHDLDNLKMHVIATDLLLAEGWPGVTASSLEDEWRPYFFPKAFVKENKDISLEQFALEEKELKELGIEVTKLRAAILSQVEKEVS